MATDTPGSGGGSGADEPDSTVQQAIDWFSSDTTTTLQALRYPAPGARSAPGALLAAARRDAEFDRLLPGSAVDRARSLKEAQAEWLIRRLPDQERPLADTAQQAGRAWGILITAKTRVLPTQDVVAEVVRRTGLAHSAADEIVFQARNTSAAYNRAEQLSPYDNAPDQALIDDWNQLVACGAELPDAATRAREVLELLTARTTGSHDHHWMGEAAQHAAQVYDNVIAAQPLLEPLAAHVPQAGQPNAAAAQARLINYDREGLDYAATAAARARAVQVWAERGGVPKIMAAGPGMRTLVRLNRALLALDPSRRLTTVLDLDDHHFTEIARRLQEMSQASRLERAPDTAGHERGRRQAPQHGHHPPQPGPGPAAGGPRSAR